MNRSSLIVGLILVLSFCAAVSNATLGLDLSYFQGDVSQSSWNCLKQSGREFAIIQAQLQSGRVNPYVANDINRAKAAGIRYVDIYIFPNINEDPATQVQNTVNYIKNNGATFGQIWIDVEGPSYWSSNCQANVNFISRMVNAGRAIGYPVHIYSSHSQWSPITCDSTAFSNLQLWWAYYDNNASFDNFQPFGGWSHPSIKQFQGTTNICGTQIDQNFYQEI